ncbi:MAG: leucine-rich repeat domain-containing protein [Bacteroidota bacterium]
MRHLILLSLSLILMIGTAHSQCDGILNMAQNSFNQGNFRTALKQLQDTEICDDKNKLQAEILALQTNIFDRVEKQKEEAIKNSNRIAKLHRELTIALKEAQDNLKVANSLMGSIYFYDGKFGLTLKTLQTEEGIVNKCGFISPDGRELIPFQYDEATPFSERDGFSRVKIDGQKYLLDTLGNTYPLAYSLEEITDETEALDLSFTPQNAIPDSIGEYPQLKILLAYGRENKGYVSRLPSTINKLTNLEVLILSNNYFHNFPEELTSLPSLTYLDLSNNMLSHFSYFPKNAGSLTKLKVLKLNENGRISELPPFFTQLSNLEVLQMSLLTESMPFISRASLRVDDCPTCMPAPIPSLSLKNIVGLSKLKSLDISGHFIASYENPFFILSGLAKLKALNIASCELTSLPSEIGALRQLQTLNIAHNYLNSLPEAITQLDKLVSIEMSPISLSEDQQKFFDKRQLLIKSW